MESVPSANSTESILAQASAVPAYPAHAFEFLDAVEERHFWFIQRNRLIEEWLTRYVPDVGRRRMLEVGCGNGTVLAHLHRRGLRVMGVDLFQTALSRCRRRILVPLSQGDATQLPFRESLGVIGLFDCLEHFDQPQRVLAEVHRCLLPEGRLLVTVPAVPVLYGWVDRLSGHRLRYDRTHLIALLQSAGFEVDRVSYFMTTIFPALVVSRLVNEWRFRRTPDAHKPLAGQFQVPAFMNAVLGWLCALDRVALRAMSLPIGGSLIALARKT